MMQEVFSKKHLMEALERAGLPCSYKSILRFEKEGVIERSKSGLGSSEYGGNRVYSKEEIENIVQKIAAYQRSKYGNTAK